MITNFKKVTYEIIYKYICDEDTTEYITNNGYTNLDVCKNDFNQYNSDIRKVVGIRKIEHVENTIPVKEL